MREFEKDMNSHLFGNPHSRSPSSTLSTERVKSTRIQALEFFKADPEYFDLIFVANATAAIKLVMDCMSDYSQSKKSEGFWYGYHGDSHTSLVGVIEVAGTESRCFASDEEVEQWLCLCERSQRQNGEDFASAEEKVGLFAYPAQSNMNGRRLPLAWPSRLRATTSKGPDVYSLLDAAAFVSTGRLDLSNSKKAPDFTALSFYKIFGFPDLGALIVRKESGHVLQKRRYFGGGTVDMVINGNRNEACHARKAASLHEIQEDGTPAFHSIAALQIALKTHRILFGSTANVSQHTCHLSKMLYDEMSTLHHTNGLQVCTIYKGTSSEYGDSETQGPTIAFNVRNSSGDWIGKSDFERLAILNNIQIRTGGVCNPGGIASSLQYSPAEMRENFDEGVRCGNELDEMHGKPTGITRISLGAMSSIKDIKRFLEFLEVFVDRASSKPQSILSRESVKYTEIAMLPNLVKALELKSMDQVKELNAHIQCPVAACMEIFGSSEELGSHLSTHRFNGRRSNKAGNGRSIWRRFLCQS